MVEIPEQESSRLDDLDLQSGQSSQLEFSILGRESSLAYRSASPLSTCETGMTFSQIKK